MLLEGSCHYGAVRFSLQSSHPLPLCPLLLLDLSQDGRVRGGAGIFLLGLAETLKIEGD